MKVILFGATGMVGQGVLRECLLDPEVESVLTIGRRGTGQQHEKLREIVHQDFFDFSAIESQLAGYDACFFCLGVSSAGMKEEEYRRLTYDITLAAAQALARQNPGMMTFLYVSGTGTDSSEKGPLHGITSSTKWTRVLYAVMGPLYPVWKTLFPKYVTTTEQLGRAMIRVAKHGAPQPILENQDLARLTTPS
ncbi:MAG TPA: NAD(P)H-binding protein [Thermoanaerobaculia bacterium]